MVAIAFINIPGEATQPLTVYPPVGILSMGAVLREAGHRVDFVDADVLSLSPAEVCEAFSCPPAIIGLTLNVSQVARAEEYLQVVRHRFPHALVVAGGPYVTGVGAKVLAEFPQLDFAVTGEGELAMLDLARVASGELDAGDVRNLVWSNAQGPVVNSVERLSNLDALPLPDYSLVDGLIDCYSAPEPSLGSPSLAVMCTRGCPYECTFCSSPGNWGRRVTFRSVESVIREVALLKERFAVKEIFFVDDTLNARPKWFFQLTDAIVERRLHEEIFFRAPFRVNRAILTKEILERAREAGFWMIFYGVESGNQTMLDRMKKGASIDEIERAFELTHQAGICSFASFMVGNDGETEKTFEDSLALLRRIRPDFGGFAVAAPFPGSRLERVARVKGHITQPDFRKYRHGDSILRTEALSTTDIVRLAHEGNKAFAEVRASVWSRNHHFKRYLKKGFYPTEQWDRPVHRTEKRVAFSLPTQSTPRHLVLNLLADYPDIETTPVMLSVRVNGIETSICFAALAWKEVTLPIEVPITEPYVFVEWEVDRTWNPKRAGMGNDNRELGITVSEIRLAVDEVKTVVEPIREPRRRMGTPARHEVFG